jgi:hypothetical protein
MADDAMLPDEPVRPPDGLTLERHRDLEGRLWSWSRRGRLLVTALMIGLVGLALGNGFGQRPDTYSTATAGLAVRVQTPSTVRGGVIFQTRVDLTAKRALAHPSIVLDRGWFDGMTLNSVQPAPVSQAGAGGGSSFVFGKLPPGGRLTVWFEWSTNPTTVEWRRTRHLQVDDGAASLARLTSTITVFP